MGIQRVNGERSFVIDGANEYRLGDVALGVVGTVAIHIVNDNAFSGTVTVKARSRVQEADDTHDAIPFLPIPYEKLYLNGAVGDGSLVSVGITGDSIILVPASGLEIELDTTGAFTAGSLSVYVSLLEGAAA